MYIAPPHLWPFIGFEWLPRPSSQGIYALHGIVGISGLMIAAGFFFRPAVFSLLISFSYLFVIEEPYYQNHYYLILLFSGLLFISQAGEVYSVDGWRNGNTNKLVRETDYWLLRFQMASVYVFAGLAKINRDWLRGEPLRIWASGTLIGDHALLVSYMGLLFDLLIVPMLLWRRTRDAALLLAVGFHLANFFMFKIGVFPWLAMAATLLFLDFDWPVRNPPEVQTQKIHRGLKFFAMAWCCLQILLPLRHWVYPGRVSWTLEGYYFSWMMRLNNRVGTGSFYIEDETGRHPVPLSEFLTPFQERVMRSDPNEILKVSRFLRAKAENEGHRVSKVTADLSLALNDHPAKPYVDPSVDLSREPYGVFVHNRWILSDD